MTTTYGPAIADGLREQAAHRERLLAAGARRLGWKAGFGTAAAMDELGISAPLIGFMTDRTLVANGATVVLDGWGRPLLEPEIAVRLSADVPAGAAREHAAAAIGEVAAAIELVDLSAADDVEAILAGNIFHRAVLLGAFAPASGGRAVEALRVDVVEDGATRAHGVDPSAVLGDLVDVVRRLADQAPLTGAGLTAGDVVITGSAVAGIPVAPGHRFEVRVKGLEPVAVALA